VLDFLKQNCPEDRELFHLVALHFSMFSEVADLWENEGHSKVHTLLAVMAQHGTAPILLTNTDDTKQCLHTAMLNFTHAAEYFLRVRTSHLYIAVFIKVLCASKIDVCHTRI
jgi:spatacsin